MVRKIILLLVAAALLSCFTICAAATNENYYLPDYVIDNSIFIINKKSMFDSYILTKIDDQYTIIIGNINLDNNTIQGENCIIYTITENRIFINEDQIVDLQLNSDIIYSNLGNYPDLQERSIKYEEILLFFVLGIFVIIIIRPIYDTVLRKYN